MEIIVETYVPYGEASSAEVSAVVGPGMFDFNCVPDPAMCLSLQCIRVYRFRLEPNFAPLQGALRDVFYCSING